MSLLERFFQSDVVRPIVDKLPIFKQLVFSIFGITLLSYLFVVLLSYNPADPAWSHISSHTEITNIGGRLGAWVADILRTFVGLGAWLSVAFLAYEIIRLWWTRSTLSWPVRIAAYLVLMVFASALMATVAVVLGKFEPAALGGVLGLQVMQSLTQTFGQAPTLIFLFLFCVFCAALTFELRWQSLFAGVLGWLGVNPENKAEKAQSSDTCDVLDDADDAADVWQEADVKHQAQNHDSALEDFLVNSGLRAEIEELSEQERLTAQIEQQTLAAQRHQQIAAQALHGADNATLAYSEDVGQTYQESHQDVYHETYQEAHQNIHQDTHLEHIAEQDWQQAIKTDKANSDAYQVTKTPERFERDDVSPYSVINEPSSQNTGLSDEQTLFDEPASVDAPKAPTAKSRAMDTLSYRMSLSPIPELSLLDKPDVSKKPVYTPEQLAQDSELLEIKLQEFNIKATVVNATVGPVVTRFEVALAAGIKASRVTKISQDLARSMSKASLRVVEVIPGKPYIGIEVPNEKREMVRLIELLDTPDYQDESKQIAIAVGKDIGGKPVIADLAKAPHMLVAGTTGSGKSVLVNSFLLSMLLKYTPDDLKLVLIDPKQLELANYGDIPHLLTPVITDMKDAVAALTWCVNEMERRYKLMSFFRVRKISEFNKKVEQAQAAGESLLDPLWQANDSVSQSKPPVLKPLPTIVIVADEFADMIMQLGKTAEEPIVRLAQKSRASGIHLLLATQRPTVNVVTGLIKSNVPARVALRVNSKVDSRTIIEEGGAEDMLGHGDMMFIGPGKNTPERMHGAYVDDDEVNRVCDAWRERGAPEYIDLSDSYTFEGEGSGDSSTVSGDELYEAAAAFVVETRKPSISSVQRKFSIGYNRAARLLDQMEERGLVSAMDHSGKRQLLL